MKNDFETSFAQVSSFGLVDSMIEVFPKLGAAPAHYSAVCRRLHRHHTTEYLGTSLPTT